MCSSMSSGCLGRGCHTRPSTSCLRQMHGISDGFTETVKRYWLVARFTCGETSQTCGSRASVRQCDCYAAFSRVRFGSLRPERTLMDPLACVCQGLRTSSLSLHKMTQTEVKDSQRDQSVCIFHIALFFCLHLFLAPSFKPSLDCSDSFPFFNVYFNVFISLTYPSLTLVYW